MQPNRLVSRPKARGDAYSRKSSAPDLSIASARSYPNRSRPRKRQTPLPLPSFSWTHGTARAFPFPSRAPKGAGLRSDRPFRDAFRSGKSPPAKPFPRPPGCPASFVPAYRLANASRRPARHPDHDGGRRWPRPCESHDPRRPGDPCAAGGNCPTAGTPRQGHAL